MSISNNEEKAVQKILCIGGSTLNKGTIKKIKDALIETEFLQEWAVIFVNHSYFFIYGNPMKNASKEDYIKDIQQEWSPLSLVFVDKEGIYSVNKNKIYILPDPDIILSNSSEEDPVCLFVQCKEENKSLKLEALESKGIDKNMNDWLSKYDLDASSQPRLKDLKSLDLKRLEMPCIDKFMMELADVKTKITDVTIAGLILCGLDGDGAYGLKAIKAQGGKTAVQNPDECCHKDRGNRTGSMPYTALNIDEKPKHQTISIQGNNGFPSLTAWLKSIR